MYKYTYNTTNDKNIQKAKALLDRIMKANSTVYNSKVVSSKPLLAFKARLA